MAMKIAIDAGHGLHTAGKRCDKRYDAAETREWTLNNRIAKMVIEGLAPYKVEIIRVDDFTGVTDTPLSVRANTANYNKADAYVSIHHNAGGGKGVETYVYLEKETKAMALAKAVHSSVVAQTGNIDRGVKSANFAVLRETNMPAILIECGFMDNAVDTPKILTDKYAKACAAGIVDGIVKAYNLTVSNVNAELIAACQKLQKAGIISDVSYWQKGKGYSDANVVALIKKMAASL